LFLVGVYSGKTVMEHVSLYRKWRPRAFNEVIGQRHVTETLSNALTSGRVVHAYLFSGPRGTGKTSTARIMAKAINCEEGPTPTPCNQCEACLSISDGTALDVIEIDAASNRRIDEIRDLLEKIPYAPTSLRTKVYIIDEVHQLTPEASSALLKTLEEPPGHVVFVLATTEPHKLLPTIISRCQRFDFSLVSTQEISRLLEHIAAREEVEIEPEALSMIAEHAHGSVRDAIGVMDQISSLSGGAVTQHQAAGILGEIESELVFEMADFIVDRDTPATLSLVSRLVDGGKDPRRFVESLISHLRYLFLIQNAAHPEEIVEATEDHFARLSEQANRLRRFEVIRLMERLGETHREMRWSEDPRLVLECALVKVTRHDADITLEGLDYRIGEIERKLDDLAGGGLTEEPRPAGGGSLKSAERGKDAGREKTPRKEQALRAEKTSRSGTSAEEGKKEERQAQDVERKPNAGEAGPEKAPGAGETPGPPREKARRAWTAALAELKKKNMMRLYALLTKAKIADVTGEKLVLGFPHDASFQLEVLRDSDDLGMIEVELERLLGRPIRVEMTALEPRKRKPGGTDVAEKASVEKPARKAKPSPEGEGFGGVDGKGEVEPPQNSDLGDAGKVARIIKERFDGEIVED
jgi:DNA polymerase III subunit gamma/tau